MNAVRRRTHDPCTEGTPPRARRASGRAGFAALLALIAMAIAAPGAMAAPWLCDDSGYVSQFGGAATGGDTVFNRADRQPDGTYQFTELGRYNDTHFNAIGFRSQDGFMYGWNNDLQQVVRVERDAGGAPTFALMGNPGGSGITTTVVGTILADGTYFVYAGTAGAIFDVSGPTATLVDTITVPAGGPAGDLAVSPVDGQIYAAANDPGGGFGVYRFSFVGDTLVRGDRVADATSPGGQWFTSAGTHVQYNNDFGNPGPNGNGIYGANLATGQLTFLGSAPQLSNVDGASCSNGIALTKDASPRTVTAGGELTYTHTMTSRALQDATVDFVDQLPAGMTYVPGGVTVSPQIGTPNNYGGTDTLSFSGTIAPQQSVTITSRVRVAPDHPCNVDVQNQSQVTLSVPGNPPVTVDSDDPTTPANPEDPTTVHVNCAADVSIVKTAATSPIVPGREATFTLAATNNGPSTARGVSVSDQLPAQFSFSSASPGCSAAGGTLTCTIAELALGASHAFTVTGRVASSVTECLANTATVTSTTPDPNTANNSSAVCPPVEPQSGLSITKTPSRTELPAGGGQVMYTLVVKNNGPSDDPGVTVSDPLAAGLTLVSAEPSQGSCSTAGNTVSCDLGRLVDGGSAQVLVTVNVHGTPGCITNTAQVRGGNGGAGQASAQVCVPPGPVPPPVTFDLQVDKTTNVRRPAFGQNVRYRIVVRNNGPAAAPDVDVTDTLNRPAVVVSVRASTGSCTRAIPMRCQLGTIQPGQSVTITVVVKPRQAGCGQRNAASATGAGTDSNPANNMDTVAICVTKIPLRITKVASSRAVQAGATLSYRILVTNPTKGLARNVRVCDRLPAGMVFVRSTPRSRLTAGQRCWRIKRLGANQSRTFRVSARVLPGASGNLVNRATASSRDAKATARARRPVRVLAGQIAGGGVTG
jgi:uncharacterized repeat protein (TIGR01451 family)